MSARQRRQLDRVVDAVARLIPELEPRVIDPTPEKQAKLGLAENALLARVGTYRSVTLSPLESGAWSIKEFDSRNGDLEEVYEEIGDVPDHLIGALFLAAAIGSIEEQLSWTGDNAVHEEIRPVLQGLSTTLQERYSIVSGAEEPAPAAVSSQAVSSQHEAERPLSPLQFF